MDHQASDATENKTQHGGDQMDDSEMNSKKPWKSQFEFKKGVGGEGD